MLPANKVSEKKKIDITDYFQKGILIDAKDTIDRWLVAKILSVDYPESKLKYTFDGWESRWDESRRFISSNIAPFRRYSKGYTGQKNITSRDWRYSRQELMEKKEVIDDMLNCDFEGFGPFKITQFLRGSHFLLIDSLLSYSAILDKNLYDDLTYVVDYFKLHIQLVIAYLKKLKTLYADYYRGVSNPEGFLNEERVAVAFCVFELLDSLQKIFGNSFVSGSSNDNNKRCQKLYLSAVDVLSDLDIEICTTEIYSQSVRKKNTNDNRDDEDLEREHDNRIPIVFDFINYFGELGGFEEIKHHLNSIVNAPIPNQVNNIEINTSVAPFQILQSLFSVLFASYNYLKEDLREALLKLAKKALKKRFLLISEKEIKDLDYKMITSLLDDSVALFRKNSSSEKIYKLTELLQLNLANIFLKSPYFEKKLRGIQEIKLIADKVSNKDQYLRNIDKTSGNVYSNNLGYTRINLYIDSDIFLKWLSDNKVIELILGDSLNVEVIKRSHDLFKFMCKKKRLDENLIDNIWAACEGKHDTIVRAIYELILEISNYLPKEALDSFFVKMKKIPIDDYNEVSLNLVKKFTENAIRSQYDYTKTQEALKEDPSEEVLESRFYGLNIMWKITIEEKLGSVLVESALEGLKNLFEQNSLLKTAKRFYLGKAFEKIKEGKSVPQSIRLIKILFETFSNTYESDSLKSVIMKFNNKYNIIELLITDLERYNQSSRESLEKRPLKEKELLLERKFEGIFNHLANLNQRLSLMDYMNKVLGDVLNDQNLWRLWNIFIVKAVDPLENSIFYKWIVKRNPQNKAETNIILNRALRITFFEKIICDKKVNNFREIRPDGFEFFKAFFKDVNSQRKNIKITKSGSMVIYSLSLSGINELWEIFQEARDSRVVESVCDFIADLHLRYTPNDMTQPQKKDVCDEFSARCMGLLQAGYEEKNEKLINNAIFIITTFFDKFEGDRRWYNMGDINRLQSNLPMKVTLRPDNIQKEFRISFIQPIGLFRRKISEEFKIPISHFKLMDRQLQVIDSDEDEIPLKDSQKWSQDYYIQRVTPKTIIDPNYHPKHMIAERPEYLDLLFKLLADEDAVYLNKVWELLMKLPTNEKIKESILLIEQPWEITIDARSMHKLLYCLQIIEILTFNQNYPFWQDKFIDTNGLIFLVSVFMERDIEVIKNNLSKRCLSLLIKLITHYQQKVCIRDLFLSENYDEKIKLLVVKILESINNVCEYSITRETKNLENCQAEKDLYLESQSYDYESQNYHRPPYIPDFFNVEYDLVKNFQDLLLEILTEEKSIPLLEEIYSYPNIIQMMSSGLVKSDNPMLKKVFAQGLVNLMSKFQFEKSPGQVLVPLLINNVLETAIVTEQRSEVYFDLIQNSILNCTMAEFNQMDISVNFDLLLSKLTFFIKNRKPQEMQQRDYDVVLTGLLKIISAITSRSSVKARKFSHQEGLLEELLVPCLFETPIKRMFKEAPPKCKSNKSRTAAFKLIFSLVTDDFEGKEKIFKFFYPLHMDADWRTKRYANWHITPKVHEKSVTGYVGLKNLGCICYMNSLMQQLYMIPTFRKGVLEVEDLHSATTKTEDNILYQLKCMFLALQESEKQYYNPKDFCQAFKDWEGNPTNVCEQKDVDEFFNMFMDQLERLIKGTKDENFIKRHFGGVLSNELICKGCPHYSEHEEPFLAVSLQVKNKKNIYQSLNSIVEGEMLAGENAYFCDKCNKKVNTLKRACLKKLPNHLLLVLTRFEFDFNTMQKVKVNEICEFPTTLNLEQYTQQGLRKIEREKSKQETQAETISPSLEASYSANEPQEMEIEYPPSYFEYQLAGVVIHMGVADSGHYYSLIKDRELPHVPDERKWYEFNDTIVKHFDPRDIPNEAYGGEEKWKYYSYGDMGGGTQISWKEKIKNAYLLFYDRVTPYTEEATQKGEVQSSEESKENQIEIEEAKKEQEQKLIVEPPLNETKEQNLEFYKQIMEENKRFYRHRHMFSHEYFEFITEFTIRHNYEKNTDVLPFPFEYSMQLDPKKYLDLEILKLGVIFFLTSLIREREKKLIYNYLHCLKRNIENNLPVCAWIIYSFSSKLIIQEFLLDCVEGEMRRHVCGIIHSALQNLYYIEGKAEKNILFDTDDKGFPKTLSANFINSCIQLVKDLKHSGKDYTEFFKIFYNFSKLGPEPASYLIEKRLIGRLLDDFHDVSTYSELLRKTDDVKYMEPVENFLGLPHQEKNKIRTALDELLQKRKEKSLMESFSANRMYMWQTIAALLPYCRFKKNSPRCQWQIGDYDCELKREELALLFNANQPAIEKIMNNASCKISNRSISLIMSYLSFEDEKMSQAVMSEAWRGIKEKQVQDFRSYFCCLKKMLSVEDSLKEKRVDIIMRYLINGTEANLKYVSETDLLQQYILKLAQSNEAVKTWLTRNEALWRWFFEWITERHYKSLTKVPNKNFHPFNRFNISKDIDEYKQFLLDKLKKFERLKRGELENTEYEWDSEDDMSEHDFRPGEKLDYYHCHHQFFGKWATAQVEKVCEDMILVQTMLNDKASYRPIWITKDSENIAEHGKMQSLKTIQEDLQELLHGDSVENNLDENMANDSSTHNDSEDFSDDPNTNNEEIPS